MQPSLLFWRGKTVCVTGGSGFLGYHLVDQLLDLEARVRVLGLPPSPGHALYHRSDVSNFFGDVRDETLVRRALAGCDVVFHTAGVVALAGPTIRAMHSVHVDGTRTVLGAAGHARVIHTSSVVAIGAARTTEPLNEESPFGLRNLRVDYVHAKRAAERLALAAARAGQDVVVTNPGYLLGPQDYEKSAMGRLCVRFWRGRMPVVPPGGVSAADVRDVARGHLLAAEHGAAGQRYILAGENHSFAGLLKLMAQAAGLAPRALVTVPWWLLASLAGISECRAACLRLPEAYPSLQQARLNRYWWFYDSTRARRELGYRVRPLAVTLADAYRWFAENTSLEVRGASRWLLRPEPARTLFAAA
jgi:dihydroflavonol-4-reductase